MKHAWELLGVRRGRSCGGWAGGLEGPKASFSCLLRLVFVLVIATAV